MSWPYWILSKLTVKRWREILSDFFPRTFFYKLTYFATELRAN